MHLIKSLIKLGWNIQRQKMTVFYLRRNVRVPVKYEDPLPRQRVFYLGVIYMARIVPRGNNYTKETWKEKWYKMLVLNYLR